MSSDDMHGFIGYTIETFLSTKFAVDSDKHNWCMLTFTFRHQYKIVESNIRRFIKDDHA